MGYSLRDPDLLHFLEQNRKLAKVEFGPHYLVLPKDECSPEYSEFLGNDYSVRVVSIEHDAAPANKWSSYEINLVAFLRQIEGETLSRSSPVDGVSYAALARIALKPAINTLLRVAIDLTGSHRGDVLHRAARIKF